VPATLTIVVPVYNEQRRLPALFEVLDEWADVIAADADLRLQEVIVVDDGSTDGTAATLEARRESDPRLRVIAFATNRGKGAAVRAGMLAARGEFALAMDVDVSTPLEEVVALRRALESGADVAIGSRSVAGARVLVHQPFYRELMGKTFNAMFRLFTGLPWRDTQCGFKLFRREAAFELFPRQRVERFAFDAELCVLAHDLGLRVAEVPVAWRNHPETRVTLVGSSFRMGLDLVLIAWRRRGAEKRSAVAAAQR